MGPTPGSASSAFASHGRSRSGRAAATRAISRIEPALVRWKVTDPINRSMALGTSRARSAGSGAASKSRRAATRLTSSKVRTERMQATTWR